MSSASEAMERAGGTGRGAISGLPAAASLDGSTLVKVAAILPYTPPTIMATYYFDKGRLVLERAHANDAFNDKGEQYEMLTTSFYEGDKPIWADDPDFDPAKAERRDTKKVAEDLNQRFDLDYTWNGDCIDFTRPGLTGQLHILKDEVRLDCKLGFLLGTIKPAIEREVHKEFDKRFGRHAEHKEAKGPKGHKA